MSSQVEVHVVTAEPPEEPRCCLSLSLRTGCIAIGCLTCIKGLCTFTESLAWLCLYAGNTGHYGLLIIHECFIVYGALHFIAGISLIYGAIKKRPTTFWLLTHYLDLAFITCGLAIIFILALKYGDTLWQLFIAYLLVSLISIGILLYLIAVVRSFCREVRNVGYIIKVNDENIGQEL